MTELLEEHGLKVLMTPLPDDVSGMTCMIQRSGDFSSLPVIKEVPGKASELLQRPLQQIDIAMKGAAGENASYRQ